MELIDGKKIAQEIKTEIALQVRSMVDAKLRPPHLAAILIGDDPASEAYVSNKERACKEVGFDSSVYRLENSITEKKLLETVKFINNDPDIDGFIVQLPLPAHINEQHIIAAINPLKDVDGFHPENVGRMSIGLPAYISATPNGIMEMFMRSKIDTAGKHCVVVGRSNIVGRPMSILMSRNTSPGNATVTVCHSRTHNLAQITLLADILIVAIGKPEFINAAMVKEGAVVIDVGIHRIVSPNSPSGYRFTGDVMFDEVAAKVSKITPVPGGVGPMTIVSLLMNTLKAARGEIYR